MLAKITLVACFIGLARSGALHNAAANLGGYGNLGAHGGYNNGLAGNLGYAANGLTGNPGYPNRGGATSYVNIVKEITNHGAHGNGAYPRANGYNGLAGYGGAAAGYGAGNNGLAGYGAGYNGLAGNVAGYNGLAGYGAGYNGAAGWPSSGYAGLASSGLPYAGGLGYAGNGYDRNLGYAGANYARAGAAGYPPTAGNPLVGVTGHAGVPTSYSNIYNGPLRSPLQGNGAYGAGAGYGGYGSGQAW